MPMVGCDTFNVINSYLCRVLKYNTVLNDHFMVVLKSTFSGFDSEFVQVAALGRELDLGMLYDCCTDSFCSGRNELQI